MTRSEAATDGLPNNLDNDDESSIKDEEEENDSPAQDEQEQNIPITDDTKQDESLEIKKKTIQNDRKKKCNEIKEREDEETPIVERGPISNSADVEETTKTTSIDGDNDAETDDHESDSENHQIDGENHSNQDENRIKEENQIHEKEEETEEDSR
eukprot:CAMPEP_0194213258 /NCGR_PEP_ID=MMETSP0156-20130528/13674_1 /TAXON_ID=33649 /ORGANISM="Thalassionema nitzschioides, Strain L26-B" /LENGTH=154 /DNA_ID=CAMNT_0038941247 /DNA_START=82 /DNA_END=548 /DNA_ORIENTATION=+